MCGIVGYVGMRSALPILMKGLWRLSYRGYDSAGVSILTTGPHPKIVTLKRAGKLQVLDTAISEAGERLSDGWAGIGHTRWATHGEPTDRNAHPHLSCNGKIAIAHNGVIENCNVVRERLTQAGHTITSDTDSELLAHLIEQSMDEGKGPIEAVQEMAALVEGTFGIVVLTARYPNMLIAARRGSPLVLGETPDGFIVASDAMAIREHTAEVIFLKDGEMAILTAPDRNDVERRCGQWNHANHREIRTLKNEAVDAQVEELKWSLEQASLGDHPHFMHKEIFEQPSILRGTCAGRLLETDLPHVHLGGFGAIEDFIRERMDRIIILGCGTSWNAGLVGERILEKLVGLPVEVAYASEFAYGHTPLDDRVLAITLSQSGETKDTILAAEKVKRAGGVVWNITNVPGSSLTRIADSGVYLYAGPEIGVASTKAYTAMIICLAITALKISEVYSPARLALFDKRTLVRALLALPDQVATILAREEEIVRIAKLFRGREHAYFLGRGFNLSTAREGALKLMELSYVIAVAYPAGEMKHGPIAVITKEMPVVIIAPREGEDEVTYAKVMSNLKEVECRGGQIILLASDGDPEASRLLAEGKVKAVFSLPHTTAMGTPVLAAVVLQLLAYHVALARGCDIDQPRNLAKSVTVE